MNRSLTSELRHLIGQTVRLQGFVHTRRDLGKMQFFVLRDRSGTVQCVGRGLDLPLPESSVQVTGKVVASAQARAGFEVSVEELRVIAAATIDLLRKWGSGRPESPLSPSRASMSKPTWNV